jgi:HSP20 family protein
MEVRYENGWTPNYWLFERMNQFAREFDHAPRHIRPAVDVVEDQDAYHFYFEMAGLITDSIDVQVENGTMIVAAERKRPEWPKESEVRVSERHYGSFRRSFQLPKDASHENVRASYRDGVLDVTVGKRPEAKPVKIAIN